MSEVVVVTGAGKGIGRAVARRFARRGVSIGLVGRGEEALEAARREVEEAGGRALVVPTAVDGQQMNGEPPDPDNREGNLFQPEAGDPGAHGRFDERAHGSSLQWWASRHRRALMTAAAALTSVGAARARG